ncbi:MAG: flagellar biosynthesis anti-sigma factor FlgM [Bdellovibrionia bacterium]
MRVGHQPGNNPEIASSKKSGRGAATGDVKHGGGGPELEEASHRRVNSDVKADISSKSKDFANAKAVANNAPDVRADKIAELKRRIADKSYKVDSAAVADKLVDDHLRMPDRD